MGLTDASELYGSMHESGFNRIIEATMRQRPSWFNYGTLPIAVDWARYLCCPIEVDPRVFEDYDSVVTVEAPMPVIGTGGMYVLNWALQLSSLMIDFFPTDVGLPADLGGGLDQQRFSITAEACLGFGRPTPTAHLEYPVPTDFSPGGKTAPPVALPFGEDLVCSHLTLHLVGHVSFSGTTPDEMVQLGMTGLEVVDVQPDSLETSLEGYLETILRFVLLPRLKVPLSVFTLQLPLALGAMRFSPSPTARNNPSIEHDEIRVFVEMELDADA